MSGLREIELWEWDGHKAVPVTVVLDRIGHPTNKRMLQHLSPLYLTEQQCEAAYKPMTDTENELRTVEELVDEIRKRVSAMVCFVELDHKTDHDVSIVRYYYEGGSAAAIGLCVLGRKYIMNEVVEHDDQYDQYEE